MPRLPLPVLVVVCCCWLAVSQLHAFYALMAVGLSEDSQGWTLVSTVDKKLQQDEQKGQRQERAKMKHLEIACSLQAEPFVHLTFPHLCPPPLLRPCSLLAL